LLARPRHCCADRLAEVAPPRLPTTGTPRVVVVGHDCRLRLQTTVCGWVGDHGARKEFSNRRTRPCWSFSLKLRIVFGDPGCKCWKFHTLPRMSWHAFRAPDSFGTMLYRKGTNRTDAVSCSDKFLLFFFDLRPTGYMCRLKRSSVPSTTSNKFARVFVP